MFREYKTKTSADLLEDAYLRSGDADVGNYQYRIKKLKEAKELLKEEEKNEKYLEIQNRG